MLSLYVRPALEKTGWVNERTIDPIEKLCKLLITLFSSVCAVYVRGPI
jgi:hypothetical protein